MNTNVNKGILAMRAANERRKQTGVSIKRDEPTGGAPRKQAKAKALPARTWRVTLAVEHEGVKQAWACPDVSAPTIKRAVKAARQAWMQLHKGEGAVIAVAGVFDKDLAALPARPV